MDREELALVLHGHWVSTLETSMMLGTGRDILLVDNQGHALFAVGALTAEEPHGLGVVDHDCEDGNLVLGGTGGDGLVRREDAQGAGVDLLDGLARVIEIRLGNGVVASKELELDHGARLGLDLLGPELEASGVVDRVAANGDNLDVDGCVAFCQKATSYLTKTGIAYLGQRPSRP